MRLFLLFLLSSFCLHAQQISTLSQWYQHLVAINPAYTGIKSCMDAQGTVRGQWINAEGAPTSSWISVTSPIKLNPKKEYNNRQGLGIQSYIDQIGPFLRFDVKMSYAGHFKINTNTFLSLGVAGGFSQLSFDINKGKPLTPDPVINGNASQLSPILNVGAVWTAQNYYIGLSVQQLAKAKLSALGDSSFYQAHSMFNAGIRLSMVKGWTALPGIIFDFSKNIPVKFQLQTLFDYSNQYYLGIGYRNQDAMIALFGIYATEQLRINYSYDFALRTYRTGNFHSHELTLNYSPCKPRSKDKNKCPLF